MLKRLYSLKEPAYNGLELAKKYHTQISGFRADILRDFELVSLSHPPLSFLVADNPGALSEKQKIFSEMESVLDVLKHTKISPLLAQSQPSSFKSSRENSPEQRQYLIDYIDTEQLKMLQLARDKLGSATKITSNVETNFILIKANDINQLKAQVDCCIESSDQFFEDYESLISHCTQLDNVISQVENEGLDLSEENFLVLSNDTQEVGMIVGDMEDVLNYLRSSADDLYVKHQQYSSFLDEYKHQASIISDSFNAIYDSVSDLFLVHESTDSLIDQFSEISNEIWDLSSWFKEYYNAYGKMLDEKADQIKYDKNISEWVSSIRIDLENMTTKEIDRRLISLNAIEKFMPSDLFLEIKESTDSLIDQFSEISNEIWDLSSWFKEYYNAYGKMLDEKADQIKYDKNISEWVSSIRIDLENMTTKEIDRRLISLNAIEKFMPSDLFLEIKVFISCSSIKIL
ncbi:hypothetical protein AYI68_g3348 [Smittium mucronatum]|uniref:Autophagy-related protein 17 n=1 Tax=Smittium mucronatum TaxID=133383 RepID=A0A1R0H072_9FUNG|nr:hypothetical protein AYI68_g3348 [Smittium mucronatum]